MVSSNDDWRAVDWAKNQVERLDAAVVDVARGVDSVSEELAGTDRAVSAQNDRLTRVERDIRELEECVGIDKEDEIPDGGLMGYMSRQGRRIREIEKRLQKNAGRRDAGEPIEVWTDRQLEKLAFSVAGLQEADARKGDRLAEIESKFDSHLQWAALHDHPDDQARRISSLEQQVVTLNAALMAYGIPMHGSFKVKPVGKIADGPLKDQTVGYDDDFRLLAADEPLLPAEEMARLSKASAPLDSECPGVPHRGHTKPGTECPLEVITGVKAMRQEAYDRGLSAGAGKALENAERHIRAYMESHFSTATIEGVVGAMRGVFR